MRNHSAVGNKANLFPGCLIARRLPNHVLLINRLEIRDSQPVGIIETQPNHAYRYAYQLIDLDRFFFAGSVGVGSAGAPNTAATTSASSSGVI